MAREDPEVRLRLATALKDRIAEAAKANNRSMNAEIVSRLTSSFDNSGAGNAVPDQRSANLSIEELYSRIQAENERSFQNIKISLSKELQNWFEKPLPPPDPERLRSVLRLLKYNNMRREPGGHLKSSSKENSKPKMESGNDLTKTSKSTLPHSGSEPAQSAVTNEPTSPAPSEIAKSPAARRHIIPKLPKSDP